MDEKSIRDRFKSLEQQLKMVNACAVVSKSKADCALASEKLILDSVKEAADGLLCKEPLSPRVFLSQLILSPSLDLNIRHRCAH